MGQMKPQPKALAVWRMTLALCMVIPAFVNALFFPLRSRWWVILSLVWIALFLAMYLVYLPLRYHKLSYTIGSERILLYSGVLYTRVRALPLDNIQYVTVGRGPLETLFGLCTLVVVVAGGRVALTGLRRQDAEALAKTLIR